MDLLKSAVKAGHRADYVLFDTWFSNPKQIAALMNDMLSRLPVHLRNCLCAA